MNAEWRHALQFTIYIYPGVLLLGLMRKIDGIPNVQLKRFLKSYHTRDTDSLKQLPREMVQKLMSAIRFTSVGLAVCCTAQAYLWGWFGLGLLPLVVGSALMAYGYYAQHKAYKLRMD